MFGDNAMENQTNSPLDRGRGVALWRQVEDILSAEIQATDLEGPVRMPSENELATRFGVNRHTIRQALSSLQDRGLVQIEQGRGTFIVTRRIAYSVGARTRFRENLAREHRQATTRLLRTGVVLADDTLAHDLGVSPGTQLGQIDAARDADGRRLCLSTHYYRLSRFPKLADDFTRTNSITEALRANGVDDYQRAVTRVSSQMPTTADARFLHIMRNRPVLVSQSVDVGSDGIPVQVTVSRFVGDLVELVVGDPADGLPAADAHGGH